MKTGKEKLIYEGLWRCWTCLLFSERRRKKRVLHFIPIIHSVFVWQIKKGPHFYAYSISLTRIKKFIIYHLGVWKNELLSVHEWSFHSLVYCFPRSASLLLLNKLKDGTIEMEEEMLNVEMARVVRINFLIQFKLAFLSSLV